MINPADAAALLYGGHGYGAGAGIAALGQGKGLTATQIDRAAQDFEAMFMAQMLEQMFGDSLGTEAFGDQESHDIYKALMVDEYGKEISRSGGIGIADYVKRELLKLQEM